MENRLTKYNAETGEYEYREKAKTQAEFIAQRKAVIQRLGELEDRAEGHWIKQKPDPEAMQMIHDMGLGKGMSVNSIYWTCSVCDNFGTPHHKYCCSCGAKMKGEADEQR